MSGGLLGTRKKDEPKGLLDVPELDPARSHGGLLASSIINGLRDAFMHPGKVFRGEADPYDTEQALNLAGSVGLGTFAGAPAGALGAGPIRAYHGSPHDFDRFSLDKVGSGISAQTEGHGIYVTDSKRLAGAYKGKNGTGYEVDVHADPNRFLDWSNPADRQKYEALAAEVGPEKASEMMVRDGVPGTKISNAGGTSYAVFDPSVIEIIRKYGIAGLALLPPAVAAQVQEHIEQGGTL